MKKLLLVTATACLAVSGLTGCNAATATDSASTGNGSEAQVSEAENTDVVEDPDTYEGAVIYEDLTALFGAIPKPQKSVTIGFAAKAFENEYWGTLKDGVNEQGEELKAAGLDVTLDVRAAQGESDEQGQAALMNDMVNKKYDAILASPISDGNLIQATDKAHGEGIPVIDTVGGFVPEMDIFVGPRHYHSGELAAEWISEKLGDSTGMVAVIMGMPKESAARARTQGFVDWFAANNTGIEVAEPQNADWDRGKAKEVMDTLIKKYPDLKAIYANNDTMAMGALEAVIGAGKHGDILVVGNDGTNEALKSIMDGGLDATVNIYPYYAGKIAVDIALRSLGGQDLPKVIYTNQAVIDDTNVDLDPESVIGWKALEFE